MAIENGNILVRMRIAFPSLGVGGEYITTDRRDVATLAPPAIVRVLEWGDIATLMDGGQDGVEVTLSNVPIDGARLSDLWDKDYPPEGAKVTFEASKETPVSWFTFFVGAVIQVSSVTEKQVVIRIADMGTKFERKIGDPITLTDFPQAPEENVGKVKPIILGQVDEFTPPCVRERKKAVLADQILATETASVGTPLQKAVNSTKGWPKTGQAQIDDEILTFDNTTETTGKKFLFTARGVAAAHSVGDSVLEFAQIRWCVSGHQLNEPVGTNVVHSANTKVYGISSQNTLKLLVRGTDYTFDNGPAGAFVTLISSTGLKVAFPADTPTYRRVEMDEAVNDGFTIGQVNPSAYPPSQYNTNATALVGSKQAKNAQMACGDAAEWGPNTYAVLDKFSHDTLCVLRHDPFTEPASPPTAAWLAVEHFGWNLFGPSTELAADIDEVNTQVQVTNLSVLSPFIGNLLLWIDGEVMAVTGLNTSTKTFTVFRGMFDVDEQPTIPKKHFAGAQVCAYYYKQTAPKPNIYFQPDLHVFLETGVNTKQVQEIGYINDITDIPPDITKNDNTYTDAKTLEAWHGHPLQGLPISGKVYSKAPFIDIVNGQYIFDSTVSDFLIGSIRTFNNACNQFEAPLHNDAHSYLNLTGLNDPYTLIFTPYPGMNFCLLQRVLKIRFRLLITNDVRLRMFAHSPDTGSVVTLVDHTFSAGSSYPPEMRTFNFTVENTTAFPDGIRVQQLFHKECCIQIESAETGARLYYFVVDLDLDDSQLAPNSTEYLSERQAIYDVPTMVSNTGSGSYSSAGKVTMPAGMPTPDTDSVVELMGTRANKWITHSGNTPLNQNGTAEGLVQFTTSPSGTSTVNQVEVYYQNVTAAGDSRILRAAVFMLVAGKEGAAACDFRLRSSTLNLSPDSLSAGGMTDHAGQVNDLVRRTWRAVWNLENREVTVKQFANEWFWQIDAGGSGTSAIWCDKIIVYIEVDKDRSTLANPKKGEQFTRVRYLDVSDKITSYSQIIDRRVEVKMRAARPLFGFTSEGQIVRSEEKQRPFLIPRVWWVFRYEGTIEEELEHIAVTTEGIMPTVATEPTTSALKSVLTYGNPLMTATAADVDALSFANVAVIEPGGDVPPLAGVIESEIEATALLSSLTKQSRLSGVWENGKYRIIHKPDVALLNLPVTTYSDTDGSILEDTLEIIRQTKDEVYNFVTVKARKEWVGSETGGFKVSKTYKSEASIAKYGKRPLEFTADFVRTDEGADALAFQLCEYFAEPEVTVRWQTTLFDKTIALKRGDVVALNHALADFRRLEVLGIRKAIGSVSSGIPVFEIEAVDRQSVADVTAA